MADSPTPIPVFGQLLFAIPHLCIKHALYTLI